MFAVAIGLGMLAANRIGLGLPILEAKLAGEKVGARIKAILPISIIIGVVGSLIIIALDLWVFNPALMAQLGEQAQVLNLEARSAGGMEGSAGIFLRRHQRGDPAAPVHDECAGLAGKIHQPHRRWSTYCCRAMDRQCACSGVVRPGSSARDFDAAPIDATGHHARHRPQRVIRHRIRLSLYDSRLGVGHDLALLGGHSLACSVGALATSISARIRPKQGIRLKNAKATFAFFVFYIAQH